MFRIELFVGAAFLVQIFLRRQKIFGSKVQYALLRRQMPNLRRHFLD